MCALLTRPHTRVAGKLMKFDFRFAMFATDTMQFQVDQVFNYCQSKSVMRMYIADHSDVQTRTSYKPSFVIRTTMDSDK